MTLESVFITAVMLLGLATFIVVVYVLVQRFIDASPAKKPPKPKTYRVVLLDDDGWPYRAFTLPIATASRLLRDIKRYKTT